MNYQVLNLQIDYQGLGLENGGYQPKLTTYLLDNSPDIDPKRTRPTVVICPGGGYEFTSDREAEAVAIKLNSFGYHAVVLRYSIAPARFPVALVEVATVVKMLREHADEWHVDKDKIFVAGFSAGGHLACSLGMFWSQDFLTELMDCDRQLYRPNGMILSYPVISSGEFAHRGSFVHLLGADHDKKLSFVSLETQVSEQTPPAFLWHTFADEGVPVENSLLLANAMRKQGVPFELHIYPNGGHGLGLANEETSCRATGFGVQKACQSWIDLVNTWIQNQ